MLLYNVLFHGCVINNRFELRVSKRTFCFNLDLEILTGVLNGTPDYKCGPKRFLLTKCGPYFISVVLHSLSEFLLLRRQLCSHTPSALNAGAKRSGATCHMAMPKCCYLAKGAKRPCHTKNMLTSSRDHT